MFPWNIVKWTWSIQSYKLDLSRAMLQVGLLNFFELSVICIEIGCLYSTNLKYVWWFQVWGEVGRVEWLLPLRWSGLGRLVSRFSSPSSMIQTRWISSAPCYWVLRAGCPIIDKKGMLANIFVVCRRKRRLILHDRFSFVTLPCSLEWSCQYFFTASYLWSSFFLITAYLSQDMLAYFWIKDSKSCTGNTTCTHTEMDII
jgi:hypothetical protein